MAGHGRLAVLLLLAVVATGATASRPLLGGAAAAAGALTVGSGPQEQQVQLPSRLLQADSSLAEQAQQPGQQVHVASRLLQADTPLAEQAQHPGQVHRPLKLTARNAVALALSIVIAALSNAAGVGGGVSGWVGVDGARAG